MKRMTSKQRQQAGYGSQLIQVSGDLVLGPTESRVAEIARAQARLVVEEFATEAQETASTRIENLDNRVIGELDKLGLLNVFSDPAFLLLLKKTQLHAAATGSDADHDILSKLLTERAQDPSKPMHMVVTRAVEVIEQIDDQALLGMTCLWFVATVIPNAYDPLEGLAYFDKLALHLGAGELPSSAGWLQRLDLMGCISYQPPGLQSLKKWHQILMATRPGYVCEGVSSDHELYIRQRLCEIHPELPTWLVAHCFNPGHFRLNAGSSQIFLDLTRQSVAQIGKLDELESVVAECKVDSANEVVAKSAGQYVQSNLPNLEYIRQWWDGIEGAMRITPLGVAIAYSNAKRFDPLLGLGSLRSMLASG
jgi:hypothetical protein